MRLVLLHHLPVSITLEETVPFSAASHSIVPRYEPGTSAIAVNTCIYNKGKRKEKEDSRR